MKLGKMHKAVGILISLGLILVLLSRIEIDAIYTTMLTMDGRYLIIAFLIYLISHAFRAIRFYYLLNKDIDLNKLFDIVCVHNMVNSIMPARTGELSYIYLLKKMHKKSAVDGASTLIVSRIFDFIAISAIFLVSAGLLTNEIASLRDAIYVVILFMFFCFLLLFALVYMNKTFLDLTSKCFKILGLDDKNSAKYVKSKLNEIAIAITNTMTLKLCFLAFITSFAIWASNFCMTFFILNGMQYQVPMKIVVVGATFAVLSTLLPIEGFLGFGIGQGVWTMVFVPLGLTLNQAIISAFSFAIFVRIFYIIIGIYGLTMLKLTGASIGKKMLDAN